MYYHETILKYIII